MPVSLPAPPGKKLRVKNVKVDHIDPVIDPTEGFTTWDEVIRRMFVEKDGLQVLCKKCHDEKTQDERDHKNKKDK